MPELVSLTDAAAIVKKPRLSAAIYAFKWTAWKAPQQPDAATEAPPSKRQRTAQPEEQGRFIHLKKNVYSLHTINGYMFCFFLKVI